jgi:hypothetical protein
MEFVGDIGFTTVKEYPLHSSFDSRNDCLLLRRGAMGPVAETIHATYKL